MEKIIRIDDHSGLVLEGGGMRGVFTCGVLDSFMDRGIRFPYTIGVSAGACNGLSYMSGQRGRAKYSNIDLLEKYNYIGLKYLLKKRNIMDFDLLFQEFPGHILPYDYEAYFHCPERYVMVTTNCETGEANYFEEKRSKERCACFEQSAVCLSHYLRGQHPDAGWRYCGQYPFDACPSGWIYQ